MVDLPLLSILAEMQQNGANWLRTAHTVRSARKELWKLVAWNSDVVKLLF
jgi:hypothetical protein